MEKLIFPRHTADLDYIMAAMKVYYDAKDWVTIADYKDRLVNSLLVSGKETERSSDETHYTKCSELPRYFGLLDREEKGKASSPVRINSNGIIFYEAIKQENYAKAHEIIMWALENVSFGRDNEGCGSDCSIEAPNVVIVASLILDGITNKEAAYILSSLVDGNLFTDSILKVKTLRRNRQRTESTNVTSDIKFIPFLKRISFLTENADGLIIVDKDVEELYRDRLFKLRLFNKDNAEGQRVSAMFIREALSTKTSLSYLTALRTKPFLLLAGISGTGKSRLVRELAYMTCPNSAPYNDDPTTPYNYCLIEVKPNWHDSSELLGYYNALDSKYEFTPFIRFAYRALKHPNTPFFVCLDEMNLAPVEQYFAEYLSVLETRTKVNGEIVSAPLLKDELFEHIEIDQYDKSEEDKEILIYLQENGLQLPANLYVIGTVNMDDTTHQFSRKVIDRAFTIEMNGGNLEEMFSADNANALQYREDPLAFEAVKSTYISANDVLEDDKFSQYVSTIKEKVPQNLTAINDKLAGTPFQVSYRVQNELILYLAYLIEQAGYPTDIDSLISEATLAVLLQKILPRLQGDDKLLGKGEKDDVFTDLKKHIETSYMIHELGAEDEQVKEKISAPSLYSQVIDKLDQMHTRLEKSYFANFF